MPRAHVRGFDVHYEIHGNAGPPLVVAHGFLGSVASAPAFGLNVADLAARGLHVIAYDARGHGRSGYTTRWQDYRWQAQVEDMLGFIDALGLERVSILGTSMGAVSGLLLALAHPERVERLVLRTPPALDGDSEPARKKLRSLAFLYRYFGAAITARLVSLGGPPDDAAFHALFRAQRSAAIVPAIRGLSIDELHLPKQLLFELALPTLVLTHPDDPRHPLRAGDVLRDLMPHAQIDVGASSRFWQRNPAVLADTIAAFLKADAGAQTVPARAEGSR